MGHAARIGNLTGRNQPGAPGVGERIILKWSPQTYSEFDFCLTVHHQLGKVI